MHSLFGVSKAAADLMVQEYGRYFDMPTVCFRGGCLTGPAARRRAAARLPVLPDALHRHRRRRTRSSATTASRCATTSTADDVVRAFEAFHRAPRAARSTTSAAGASRTARCARRSRVRADLGPRARLDVLRPGADGRPPLVDQRPRARSRPTTPSGSCEYDLETTLREIHDANVERWLTDLAQACRCGRRRRSRARSLVRDERARLDAADRAADVVVEVGEGLRRPRRLDPGVLLQVAAEARRR